MENKQYHHGNLRNSLIEAGIELINNQGEGGFSLRKVAALCGVSPAAPYSHFENKEDLLIAMRDYVTDQFMDIMAKTIDSFQNKYDPKLLVQIGKCYVMFFLENPQYFSFLFSRHGVAVNLSLKSDGERNFPPYKLMKNLAVPLLGEMGMPEEKMEDAIIALWATVHGLAAIATMKNVYYDKKWEDKIEDIIWNK